MLGSLNEKKVLIYFSSGLNLNGIDNQAQFQATTNAAIRANTVVLHHRRARPGGVRSHGRRHQARAPGGASMYSGAGMAAQNTRFQASQDTMYATRHRHRRQSAARYQRSH